VALRRLLRWCGDRPLRGAEGILESRKGVTRLVLRVATPGQAVAVEMDAGLLEPMD
jgi:hypothetical protein